jgi:MFS family permease
MNFNAFGYTSSFGIFQAYYTETYHYSASAVAWIGTVNICLIYLMGIVSGRVFDAGHYRICTAVGLSMQLIGIFATSFSTKYWQFMLAQGLCQGIGNGLLFCPAVANVATYFSPRKRALPVAWVACGGGTGGLVFPAIAKSILGKIGFGWTLRVMGFVMLFNAVLIVVFSRTRLSPKAAAPYIDMTAFEEPAFAMYCLGIFLIFWAIWIVYFFIRTFALDILGASRNVSFDLLLVLNGLGVPGRLIPALISDRYVGPVNALLASSMVASVLLFCWIAVGSIEGLYAWDAMYGFFAGSIQALTLASASSFTPDMSKVGSRVGLAFVVLGISSLTGPAIGGALIHHSYLPAQLFAGVGMTLGSLALALARIAQTGPQSKSRVRRDGPDNSNS